MDNQSPQPVGTRITYRKWGSDPTAPLDRIGVIKSWGRKYITLTNEATGREDYAHYDGFKVCDASVNTLQVCATLAPEIASPSTQPTLQVGSVINYRKWGSESYNQHDRTGAVLIVGRKYITITNGKTGKKDYAHLDGWSAVNSSGSPSPAPMTQNEPAIAATPVITAATPATISPFTALSPHAIILYRYNENEGGHFGYFRKYEKIYRRVTIDTIPAYGRASQTIHISEDLVSQYA